MRAVTEGVPGDFAETGVWRGGATILMRGVRRGRGISDEIHTVDWTGVWWRKSA